jgi:YVTN family beta-propeller protein
MDEHPILWKVRTRWAAVGAAVAVVAGAGGIAVSGATNAQLTPSETAITPCRIMDTRASSQVGPRNTPLGTNTTHTIQVTGKNGNCNIPSDTSSVLMNVTLVSPAQPGFITVFPAGPDRPTASNLNYTAGQAPTPNLVKAALSNDGRVSFYASFGNVDLVADVVAYTSGARLSTSDLAQNRWDRDRAKPLTVAVATGPIGVAFDGTNIWVTNAGSSTVSKINPTTNTVTATVTVGTRPIGVAFDGTNIWVINNGSNNVTKLRAGS